MKALRWLTWQLWCVGFVVDGRNRMRRMRFSDTSGLIRIPFSGQVVHHPAAAAAGILKYNASCLAMIRKRRFTHRVAGSRAWIVAAPAAHTAGWGCLISG